MLYDERWGKTKLETKLQPWQVILLLAADDLETNGWCQRDFADGTGSHCAIGAIHKVIQDIEVGPYEASASPRGCRGGIRAAPRSIWLARHAGSLEALARLERALKLPIAHWNDHPSRTKEEVIAKLREVAMGERINLRLEGTNHAVR